MREAKLESKHAPALRLRELGRDILINEIRLQNHRDLHLSYKEHLEIKSDAMRTVRQGWLSFVGLLLALSVSLLVNGVAWAFSIVAVANLVWVGPVAAYFLGKRKIRMSVAMQFETLSKKTELNPVDVQWIARVIQNGDGRRKNDRRQSAATGLSIAEVGLEDEGIELSNSKEED